MNPFTVDDVVQQAHPGVPPCHWCRVVAVRGDMLELCIPVPGGELTRRVFQVPARACSPAPTLAIKGGAA